MPLRERVARARMEHAEMLLSIHADALPDSAMRGLSVYTLSDQASDRASRAAIDAATPTFNNKINNKP